MTRPTYTFLAGALALFLGACSIPRADMKKVLDASLAGDLQTVRSEVDKIQHSRELLTRLGLSRSSRLCTSQPTLVTQILFDIL